MIYITKDVVNTICLTLTESTTITNPFFLFVFTPEFSGGTPINWVGSDTSSFKERYNAFQLIEGVDVTFERGQYIYEVYEAVSEPTTIEDCVGKIEEGRMVVELDNTTTSIYD